MDFKLCPPSPLAAWIACFRNQRICWTDLLNGFILKNPTNWFKQFQATSRGLIVGEKATALRNAKSRYTNFKMIDTPGLNDMRIDTKDWVDRLNDFK